MSKMTKHALADSFKQVLKTKRFPQVTISDITNGCGVNRMTFYYHFKDIYDLTEWIFLDATQQLLANKKAYPTWEDGFLHVMELLRGDRVFVLNIYRYANRKYLGEYLGQVLFALVREVIEDYSKGMSIRETDKLFVINFYKYALVGILLDWIKDDMKEEPSQMLPPISRVVSGTLTQNLKQFE